MKESREQWQKIVVKLGEAALKRNLAPGWGWWFRVSRRGGLGGLLVAIRARGAGRTVAVALALAVALGTGAWAVVSAAGTGASGAAGFASSSRTAGVANAAGAVVAGVANVELITVTNEAAALSWVMVDESGRPAAGSVGTSVLTVTRDDRPGGLVWRVESAAGGSPYQYAEVHGLWPGVRYRWRVEAIGAGGADQGVEGVFATLIRPAGKELFSFAVINDLHVGEMVSGLLSASPEFPPGMRSPFGNPARPYWDVMLRTAVEDINRSGVSFVVADGDLTSGGRPSEVAAAKKLLDGLRMPYYVVRGNHDRPRGAGVEAEPAGTEINGLGGVAGAREDEYAGDALGEAFAGRGGLMDRVFRFGGIKFILIDTLRPRVGAGQFTEDSAAWLERELDEAEKAGEKAFIFLHHNVSRVSAIFGLPPVKHALPWADAKRLLGVVGRHHGVVAAIISGHTHRNLVTWSALAPDVPLIENAALKEYPGGYSVITVYEGGWTRAFWRVRGERGGASRAGAAAGVGGVGNAGAAAGASGTGTTDRADGANSTAVEGWADPLQWVDMTRGEYLGFYPAFAFGNLQDRNAAYEWPH